MSDDPWKEPAAKKWVDHVLSDMAPKLRDSAFTISIPMTMGT